MKSFRVTLDQTLGQTTVVEVEAETEEQAEQLVQEQIDEQDVDFLLSLDWSSGEVEEAPMIADVEEV